MDVTEVALHQVTDDFIAYTKEIGTQLGVGGTGAESALFLKDLQLSRDGKQLLYSRGRIAGDI